MGTAFFSQPTTNPNDGADRKNNNNGKEKETPDQSNAGKDMRVKQEGEGRGNRKPAKKHRGKNWASFTPGLQKHPFPVTARVCYVISQQLQSLTIVSQS